MFIELDMLKFLRRSKRNITRAINLILYERIE